MSTIFRPVKLLFGLLLFTIVAAYGSDVKLQGIKEYEAGHHDTAIKYFAEALRGVPSDAVLHYYLANSLSHLNQFEKAIGEYKAAQALSKDVKLSQYCQSAIDSLEKRVAKSIETNIEKPVLKASNKQAELSGKISDTDQPLAFGQITDKQPALDSTQTNALRQAIERINSQASTGSKSLKTEEKTLAKRKADNQDVKISKLREEESARIEYMRNYVAYDRYGQPYHLFTDIEIRLAQENYELKIADMKINSAKEVQSVLDQSSVKEKALTESAKSLISQLGKTSVGSTDSANLVPTGTNIYVRNYLSNNSTTATPIARELLATQDKIILDPHKRAGKWHYDIVPDGLSAQQESLAVSSRYADTRGNSAKFTNTGVHGQLLTKHE
jgi:tetratricopeptide (TPR) repeat protein